MMVIKKSTSHRLQKFVGELLYSQLRSKGREDLLQGREVVGAQS